MADYTRVKNKIRDNSTGKTQVFDSINLAKKESRRLQNSGSSLEKADHFPKVKGDKE